MKKVGIVLINYQAYAQEFLIPCCDALRAQKYDGEVKIYLVDNASSEESKKYLQESYPEAQVLAREDGNYCAASNLGFQKAIEDGCEYLVALNMDTEVQAGWLSELIQALEKNPSAGLAQSLIYLAPKNEAEKNNPLINTAGNIINFLFFGFTSFYGRTLAESKINLDSCPEIAYASGCSFAIRQEVFLATGPYNEDLYMYHDDLELSLKARLAGWKIILAPRSQVFHKYQFVRNTRNLYYMERSRQIMYRAFYSRRARIFLALPYFLMEIGLSAFSIFGGWFGAKMKLYPEIWSGRFQKIVKKERRELLRVTKFSGKKVAASFSGRVQFAEIDNFVLKYLANPALNWYWQIIKHFI